MFGPKTVDQVLNQFSKALEDLESICENHEVLANELDAKAADLAKKARDALAESKRANRVRLRIKELLA